jgi:hypothetical protein
LERRCSFESYLRLLNIANKWTTHATAKPLRRLWVRPTLQEDITSEASNDNPGCND